ncbi:MAG: GGDEF domain-containing protein [Candidatus Hydrogenedentes bacterium]|nr:GGDEF domain-containing protein [Candidatus Hydrogenedentota bacterium]
MTEDVQKLREAIEDLQVRLRDEMQLRTELERRCHLLEKLAHRDPTTGLRTETYLRARIQEEIQRSFRYPSATTLITLCAPKEKIEEIPQLGRRLGAELRTSDHVFSLSKSGLAILLVETPEEGARKVLERLSAEMERFIGEYGYSVTSFPVDTNLADEFLQMAMERHNQVAQRLYPETQTAFSPVN